MQPAQHRQLSRVRHRIRQRPLEKLLVADACLQGLICEVLAERGKRVVKALYLVGE